MRDSRLTAAALMAAVAGVGFGSSAQVLPRDYLGEAIPKQRLDPRRSGHRMGRRFGYGRGLPVARDGVNPPGTKLAKKVAKGTLTLNGLK